MPAAPTVTSPDAAVPPPDSVPPRVVIGVAQVVSPGPYSWNGTVPVGWNPPETVAVSDTTPPAGSGPDGVVAMPGVALTTTTCSSPHAEMTGSLLPSPLYEATHRSVPTPPAAMFPDAAVPLSGTVPVRVAMGVAQPVSPGPDSWNVTVPVGRNPPDSVAVSARSPPAGAEPDGVVAIDGVTFGACSVIVSVKPGDRTPLSGDSTSRDRVAPGTAPAPTETVSVKVASSPLVTVRLSGVRDTDRFGSQSRSRWVTVTGRLCRAARMVVLT